tara:strand:- start:118 stop:291 length:174 start_codon:yes stop_codon:yes gene_type:complete
MIMTNNQIEKTAEEKQAYVQGKTAYWPKSMVARFAVLEENIAKLDEKMTQILAKKTK